MAIAVSAHNQPSNRTAGSATTTDLVDRWTLTGISPCCACTGDGRVDR